MTDDEYTRRITDSRVLAALAHPLRRRLMDVLNVYGPATVSTLAERTDQAIGNVSHHLRVLAAAELIEEAPDLARDRRERWWRLTSASVTWSSEDFGGDPASEAVASAALSMNLERQLDMVRAFRVLEGPERDRWRGKSFASDSWLRLTPDELEQLCWQVVALFRQWSDREIPDDGQERDTVFVFAHGVPGRP